MKKFVYVDAGASWLKPQSVVEIQAEFLRKFYANAGRGICARAGHVDDLIAASRAAVSDFIGAGAENIVWTSGTTDGFNRIVNILKNTRPGKKLTVAVSDLDHHSARLPWEMWAQGDGVRLVVMPLTKNFNIDTKRIPKVDVMVITAMSNVLGVAQKVGAIIDAARKQNPKVITIVDAAQYVAHSKLDVRKIDCDFLCFSGHKIGADTGVGVLYIKNPDDWMPDKFGGGMVNRITDSKIVLNKSPEKFEAGTLPITQIIGMPAAIKAFEKWDGGHDLVSFVYDELSKVKNIKIISSRNACMVTLVPKDMHVLDFGAIVGAHNVCMRVGNMCASWIHKKLGVDGSARISFGPWNTTDDAKYVVDVIKNVVK